WLGDGGRARGWGHFAPLPALSPSIMSWSFRAGSAGECGLSRGSVDTVMSSFRSVSAASQPEVPSRTSDPNRGSVPRHERHSNRVFSQVASQLRQCRHSESCVSFLSVLPSHRKISKRSLPVSARRWCRHLPHAEMAAKGLGKESGNSPQEAENYHPTER